MNFNMTQLIEILERGFRNEAITNHEIFAVLLVTCLLSAYEYIIYRYVSKRSFYSKQFNIILAVIPVFISTIIMTLQSSLIITLGTIGALAIIRFRTAVKDPIDMVYLLWSVHIGITCGTELYMIGVATSAVATVMLLVLDLLPLRKPSYLFVVNIAEQKREDAILLIVKALTKHHKVRSRNMTKQGLDLIIELRTNKEAELIERVYAIDGVTDLSLIAHDDDNMG